MRDAAPLRIETDDYHSGGEPFRIVVGGAPHLEGATVLDRRDFAREHADDIRQLLINEPRGHADMYGCFVTPPDDEDGDLGVVFFHKDGFSTACGHGTIALVTWAIDSGAVVGSEPETVVVVDAPSGRLHTSALVSGGKAEAVTFRNVPSYVAGRDISVATDEGEITADVVYGGAFYASVDAAAMGIKVVPTNVSHFIEIGRRVKRELFGHPSSVHGEDDRLSGIYGTIFFETLDAGLPLHQRNVTVFADGEVDRSPCGSGTSGRLALLHEQGRLGVGDELIHDSIVGSRFVGRIVATDGDGGGVITEITGSAHRTGTAVFTLDPADAIGLGFQLR